MRREPSPRPGRAGAPSRWRVPNPFCDVFLAARPFWVVAGLVVVFTAGVVWPPLVVVGRVGAAALALAVLADGVALWGTRGGRLAGARHVEDPLSMGDDNVVRLDVENGYPFAVRAVVLDEVPVQFQAREAGETVRLAARERRALAYTLRPTERGAYAFGRLLLYATGPLGLVLRRFTVGAEAEVKVYPSVLQMRRYAFLAASNRLDEAGVKRVRRIGQTMEFDQIRTYVPGDDRRTVNWKATARRGAAGGAFGPATGLLVNQYQEERAQPVVAVLDMGRTMASPFEGLTLLDHSVNAALVLLNTALLRHDKAGLVTFDDAVRTVLPPTRGPATLPRLLDALYRQQPGFRDPTYEGLYAAVRTRLRQRSLVLLFTNLDTRAGLDRQLPYLRRIARLHRLVVVLFENTGIRALLDAPSERAEDAYVKAVAEGLALEKREIARVLERSGIGALLTTPERLTVDAVNRYLQIKARGAI